MTGEQLLFRLIRSEFQGDAPKENAPLALPPEALPSLYQLAKRHDMTHLLAAPLERMGLLQADEIGLKLQKQQMMAVYRYQGNAYELRRVCDLFEKESIAFIPLKGSVLRGEYPQPWMRTSCDIDILIHEEDLDRACAMLVERYGYTNRGREYHDVSLFSPGGVHLELHFDLVEAEYANGVSRLLQRVWDYAIPRAGCQYHMELTDDMFYCYHVAHMAKHVEFGGCGIRPFLDLWILDRRADYDADARDGLLKKGGLLPFANTCRHLAGVWFDGAAHSALTQSLESFILHGGVYGTLDNRVASRREKRGGRVKYILSRIFLPYGSLREMYPILKRHRWLTPVCQVRRWVRLVCRGRVKGSLQELAVSRSMSKEQIQKTADLFRDLGL